MKQARKFRIAPVIAILVLAFVVFQFRTMIYLNLRDPDPILPGWEEYDAARFADLQARGEPLLVEIYAPWCPTCYAQHRAFETLSNQGKAPQVRAIRVDFDRDRAFVQSLGVNYTGLLILYRDGTEVDRAAGLVTPEAIQAFFSKNKI